MNDLIKMQPRIILDTQLFNLTIDRLCHQLIENHKDFSSSAIIGVQPRGVLLAERIHQRLTSILSGTEILFGVLDFTFHRDDLLSREEMILPSQTKIGFQVEGKRIILVDDVLYTGRTIRSALDALIDYGRPEDVELLVMIDRRLHRTVPIQAKYVGKRVDSIVEEQVKVEWAGENSEDRVWIVEKNNSDTE